MIQTGEVKAAATARQEERSSVAQTLPAANSLGPARRVRETQSELHAQLLLALHSQRTLKGESPGHIH